MTGLLFSPGERYSSLIAEFAGAPGVTLPLDTPGAEGKFGAAALKVNKKIFAMLVRGRLVVKLPRDRVNALVVAGEGERFEPGTGKLMKEWLMLDPESEMEWVALAREALAFVSAGR